MSGFFRKNARKHRLAILAAALRRDKKKNFLLTYVGRHFSAALTSLDRLICTPVASLLTIAVIAIALSLPVGLYVLLQNAKYLGENLDRGTQISLYIKKNAEASDVKELISKYQNDPQIADVRYISAEDGLLELQKSIDVTNILAELKENPLPAVVVITPKPKFSAPLEVESLLNNAKAESVVEMVRVDRVWLERLYYIINLGKQCVIALFALFAISVVLIIGNTIRLAMQNARTEISVLKLIGATDAYVRRQFLYTGFYYGLLSSMLSWVIVTGTLLWLADPVRRLALTYGSSFALRTLDWHGIIVLWGIGVVLGLCGAWLAVGRHLRKN
ncbi:MAG: permease-like cell division protein FtsX [Gammaproteobacteria bacterium]